MKLNKNKLKSLHGLEKKKSNHFSLHGDNPDALNIVQDFICRRYKQKQMCLLVLR